jgi:[ribosomal protein S18]-alanine N-acetyltransferase
MGNAKTWMRNETLTTEGEAMQETADKMPVHFRWMIRRDLDEVLAIEAEAFEFPWTELDFIRMLRQRTCIGQVAEYRNRVIGYMVYDLELHKIKLLNFAVAREFQRTGVGRQMAQRLIAKLSAAGRRRLVLMVRESNLVAQKFWHACGLRATDVVHCPFEDSDEDGYRFQYRRGRPVSAEACCDCDDCLGK